MSGETFLPAFGRRPLTRSLAVTIGRDPPRTIALGAALVLLAAFLGVPYSVTDVVGGTWWLTVFVVAAFLAATALAVVLPEGLGLPVGMALGLGIFVAGLGGYLVLIPDVYYALFTAQRVYQDTVALLAGQSVLLLLNADAWAIGITPGPLFLTWYFALRRHYELAAIAGGVTLGFFTLTGDASSTATTVGMTGALGVLGFGSIDRWDGTWDQMQDLGLVLVGAVIAARFLDLVPDGRESASDVFGAGATLEGTLVGSPGQIPVVGSITLSPKVRFTVEADESDYWRVASYDRYTGQGWISTAEMIPYRRPLAGPPGGARENVQVFEFEARSKAMPAAWKPVYVGDSAADGTVVANDGSLQPVDALRKGDRYRVVSRIPEWSADDLRASEKAYPASVRDRYLQLPQSTPARLRSTAREIAEDVESPYVAAENIRDWLQSEKSYSLDVPRLGSDVADRFVFDLERGYCVHFATALAVMLRSIDIPARFVVGYTAGESVGENRYQVRGLHSHAWTEVFFPETGWVRFDATPAEPRDNARRDRLERSDAGGGTGSGTPSDATPETSPEADGTNDSGGTIAGEPGRTPVPRTLPGEGELGGLQEPNGNGTAPIPSSFREDGFAPNGSDASANDTEGRGGNRFDEGDRLTVLAGAVGLTLGAYRTGLLERAYRSVWIRSQSATDSPVADVERAFERLEYLLERDHRDREPDETPRAYVTALEAEDGSALDDRVHRIVELYERVRYSDDPRPELAAEAVDLVDRLVAER